MNPVMNTIPTTFNQKTIPYTIIGGVTSNKQESSFLGAVILSRGCRYNFSSVVKSLINIGCKTIISIEASQKLFDFEKIKNEYPSVKFLLPAEKASIGEMINIGVSELNSDYAFVFWNDQFILQEAALKKNIEDIKNKNIICTTPILLNKENELIYTQITPVLKNTRFYTEQNPVVRDKTKTIYPFDFTGIYNCKSFMDIGGFDYTIINPYWQNLDFGFRSHLWGYEIKISTFFKMQYLGMMPAENIFADNSYARFYIKNLAPIIKNNKALIKRGMFFSYAKQMGANFFKSYKSFKDGKTWIHINRHRFKTSAYDLISDWSPVL